MNEPSRAAPAAGDGSFSAKHFATLKLFLVGLVGVCLLAPMGLIAALVYERESRHDEVVREIGNIWGQSQSLAGPVLVVPVRQRWRERVTEGTQVVERERQQTVLHYFLPERLAVTADLQSQVRRRGIYESIVYTAALDLQGHFRKPDMTGFDLAEATVLWEQAYLALAVTDLRGTRGQVTVTWRDTAVPMQPGSLLTNRPGGMHAPIADLETAEGDLPFALSFGLNGSQSFYVSPVGKETSTRLRSDWPSPSFDGSFLPIERTVTEDGFEAQWDVSYFGRSYPQAWSDRTYASGFNINLSAFGVELLNLVDVYRQVERSVKYGVLFIAVTFGVFFLFEVMLGLRIHPIQYALVGACLTVFYLLVLSLAEVAGFGLAYAAAVALSVALITIYMVQVVASARRAVFIGGGMIIGYAYLFVLLQLEDLSLLLGSFGLFAILAAVMIATRGVDWYGARGPNTDPPPAA